MIVDVCLFAMSLLLTVLVVIVAVGQTGMVMLVRVPIGTMLELITVNMMMSHVVVVMAVRDRVVGVGSLLPFAFSTLLSAHVASFTRLTIGLNGFLTSSMSDASSVKSWMTYHDHCPYSVQSRHQSNDVSTCSTSDW